LAKAASNLWGNQDTIRMFFGVYKSLTPNTTSVRSAVFARGSRTTDAHATGTSVSDALSEVYILSLCGGNVLKATAKVVADEVVSMLSKVSDVLAEKQQVGDPVTSVRSNTLTLDVARQTARTVVRTPVISHIGSVHFDGHLDVPPNTCVIAKVPYNSSSSSLSHWI